jgi:ketosteroid isomerase-like protein
MEGNAEERDRMSEQRKIDMLRAVAAGFDRHDLDAILEHFADDAVFESPRGADPWGQRFEGKERIRAAFAGRFAGIPDVRYLEDTHFVSGDRGVSQWTLRGTTTDGEELELRGCDIWTFRDDKIAVKDSYWKLRVRPR